MKRELIISGEAKVLVWELTESVDTLYDQLNLTESDNAAFNNIVSVKRKLEFLGIRVALQALVGKKAHIEYDADGKPHLIDKSYHISVSHSNKWIAVITHPTAMVGIDIECPTDKIQKIYKRFMSFTEQQELSEGKDIRQLLLAWSAKEALYKIIGKEAIDFATQLRIYPFVVSASGEMKAQHIPAKTFYRLMYQQSDQYTLVYCLAK